MVYTTEKTELQIEADNHNAWLNRFFNRGNCCYIGDPLSDKDFSAYYQGDIHTEIAYEYLGRLQCLKPTKSLFYDAGTVSTMVYFIIQHQNTCELADREKHIQQNCFASVLRQYKMIGELLAKM